MRFKGAQQESKEFELKQTKEKLEKVEGESDANKQWRLKREFAIKTLDYFRQIKLDITSEIRLDVAKRTEIIFKKLITRAGEIKQIEIDPAYNMNVIDVNGDNIIGILTAGQTLCLSLSYIAAVRAVTDTDYPMIIDSPLGRISGPERVELAKILPTYLEGVQMSFLVTDTEYSAPVEDSTADGERIPSVKEVWDTVKRIWKRFNLKFDKSDPDDSDTTVEESK